MPTILTSKEETDKTVPIDTSGESMDIEIENKQDDVEENTVTETQETQEEGEEYSIGVKKRIDKLTFKIREAERQKEEALKYAQGIKTERDQLKGKITKVDEGYIQEYSARVKSEFNKAESVLQSAINAGDVKAQVEAQKAIARLAIEEERANSSIKQREQIKENLKNQPAPQAPAPVQQAAPDPKAENWASENEWFGKNEAMTYTALSIHKKLIKSFLINLRIRTKTADESKRLPLLLDLQKMGAK